MQLQCIQYIKHNQFRETNMVNWKSTDREYTPIQSTKTRNKAMLAQSLRAEGISVQGISTMLNLSKSRIYEYLRKDFIAPNKD